MARKPTVNAEVRDNNDTKNVLTWHDFSLMRAYLATFDGIPLLSQETMAKRLGCTSTNTYSKWSVVTKSRRASSAAPWSC